MKIKPMTSAELREWRMRRGLSQLAMGKLLGVRQATISQWEIDITVTNPVILRLALGGLGARMPTTHDSRGHRLSI